MYDVIIIGGGIAGFSAAMYTGRFNLKTLVLSEKTGGTLVLAGDIANYPGFKKISGMDLFDKVKEHASDYGIEVVEKKADKIEKISKDSKPCFRIHAGDKRYETKSIILATGSEWRKLEVPGDKEFAGKGVHYCALCDGAFYKELQTLHRPEKDGSVLEFISQHFIKWEYILERAPWFGGFYERMIQSVKVALKKSVGRSCLSLVEFTTHLLEIEACLNSRPLVYVSGNDIEEVIRIDSKLWVITDGSYRNKKDRLRLRDISGKVGHGFILVKVVANEDLLLSRIDTRLSRAQGSGREAYLEVKEVYEDPDQNEKPIIIHNNSDQDILRKEILSKIPSLPNSDV